MDEKMEVMLTLTIEKVNIILDALSKGIWKDVNPIIVDVQGQAQKQIAEKQKQIIQQPTLPMEEQQETV